MCLRDRACDACLSLWNCRRQGGVDLGNHVSLEEAQELQRRVRELELQVRPCCWMCIHQYCVKW